MRLKQLKNISLFKNEKLKSLEKLKYQGFCNINYKLTTSKNIYLIREFKSNKSVNISRDFEYKIQKKAYKKNIASKPLYINKEKSFMITEFLKGSHKEMLKLEELKNLIKNLKKLHKIKTTEKVYDLKKDFKNYEKILKDKESKKLIKDSLKKLNKIKNFKKSYVTTHHDLNPKNIIFHKNSIKFIDWEYVGVNNCFFDLATICVEFKLSKKMQTYLLKKYLKKVRKEDKISLNVYIKVYNSLCKLWFKTLK